MALAAVRGGYDDARHLAACALDRRLMYAGWPQKYGTQYRVEDGRFFLWPVRGSTSDACRRRWNVPPLTEALAFAEQWGQSA
jgi:hypothetical protein